MRLLWDEVEDKFLRTVSVIYIFCSISLVMEIIRIKITYCGTDGLLEIARFYEDSIAIRYYWIGFSNT